MRDNYELPMHGDVLTAVRRQLATVPDAVKAVQGFSGLPHVSHASSSASPPIAAPVALQAKLRLGGRQFAARDDDSSNSECDEDEQELGAALGNDEFWTWLLGDSPRPIAIAGPKGRGGAGGKVIKLPRDFLQQMYRTFPMSTDPRTGLPVNVCLRSLCHPVLGPDKKTVR